MDMFNGSKRSSISFGSYQRTPNQSNYFPSGSPYSNNANNSNNNTSLNPGNPTNLNNNGNVGTTPTSSNSNQAYITRSPMYSPLNFTHQGGISPAYPQLFNFRNSTSMGTGPGVCEYESNRPLFALDWSQDDYVCLGSYKEDNLNKLQIIHTGDLLNWNRVAEYNVTYPVSNIQWIPAQLQPRKFATCSDSLRLWSLREDTSSIEEILNLSYCKYNKLRQNTTTNGTNDSRTSVGVDPSVLGQFPPITSFHWNPIDTNFLISSSIDTTCIVWDLQSNNYVKTQLIAHDSEVFDVRFLTQSTQLFASCGGDGSVRVFDLRSLAHSTIIYESAANTSMSNLSSGGMVDHPGSLNTSSRVGSVDLSSKSNALLRLEPSPTDPNVIATFGADSNSVLILDMRNPGTPVLTLDGHSAPINQIKWHPTKKNTILSSSDDCQVLYWNLNDPLTISPSENGEISANSSSVNINSDQAQDASSMSNVPIWNTRNDIKSMDTPFMSYTSKGREVNNIVWRPRNGDWFGAISGKRFQNVKVFS
ncbi:hypothetical protein TBLA_0A02310 [Henningerozyma blattae CBS 6284]|uniref:Anaphase-promoting complex subunit 4 WD40 domain-containing protein n=1 Tax=Henningerozyma blattae (strain ATCC 34711 / CBS 6284 / DSM 70876 / NBRC 10599 / NRRL Y-10934 / UCD 77-7) TaxID=1071380 RepID=I2GV79_HENB6|nr:hypothetical protein TBLA_0A02310 [Tetrapisispora blattae CBS 6284]CCH58031.1 hypothetical protein TBLA_0A02310 [Tetrapisispora blattae CBS 6284]